VGLNTAFQAIVSMPEANENLAAGNWYWPQVRPLDANGLPVVNWDDAPEVLVGVYSVRYVVERMCQVANVSDPLRECLVKSVSVPRSAQDGQEALDPPSGRQYRATVRVIGPKNTTTFIQSLMTKG
jgi:type IV pilus assembly protein PilX